MYTIFGRDNCKWCDAAKQLCESKGIEYEYIDVVLDPEMKTAMALSVQSATGSPPKTVPQIFDLTGYIGGYTELKAKFDAQEKASLVDFGVDI